MTDRDMYYNSYGYGGFTPLNNIPNQIPPMMTNPINSQISMPMPNNTYTSSQLNDMNERLNRLERQVKRIEQRLTRLETPYVNTNSYNPEPDNNMYMM